MPTGQQYAALSSSSRRAPTPEASCGPTTAAPNTSDFLRSPSAPAMSSAAAHGNAAMQRLLHPTPAPAAGGDLGLMSAPGQGIGGTNPPDDPTFTAICERLGIEPPVSRTHRVVDAAGRSAPQEADLSLLHAELLGRGGYEAFEELQEGWAPLQQARDALTSSLQARQRAGESVDEHAAYQALGDRTQRAHDEAREAKSTQDAEERRNATARSVLMKGWSFEESVELSSSVDIPIFLGLLANLSLQGECNLEVKVGPDGDINALQGSFGQVAVGWKAAASVSGSVGVGLGLGAGTPGVMSAGVRGVVKGELSGGFEAGLEGTADLFKFDELDKEPEEQRAIAWEVAAAFKAPTSLTATGSVQPYMKLGGHEFSWDLPLVSYELASCAPSFGIKLPADEKKDWFDLDQQSVGSSLKINHPAWADQGISRVLSWLDGEDDNAHRIVHDAQKAGVLDAWTTEERAKLFAQINDGWSTDSHEGSMLALLHAECSVEARWELLRVAWQERFGADVEPTRADLKAWAERSMNDRFWGLGHDNQTAFNELMGT